MCPLAVKFPTLPVRSFELDKEVLADPVGEDHETGAGQAPVSRSSRLYYGRLRSSCLKNLSASKALAGAATPAMSESAIRAETMVFMAFPPTSTAIRAARLLPFAVVEVGFRSTLCCAARHRLTYHSTVEANDKRAFKEAHASSRCIAT